MSVFKRVKEQERFYQVPSSFLSLKVALNLTLISIGFGVLGFIVVEGYNFIDALYMSIITISTVGYTEVRALTDSGKIFASIYIILNVGLFAYVLAVFSYYVIQGEIFKKMHFSLIARSIEQLSDHVILCGYGRYGKEVAAHFNLHNIPYVIIEMDPERIKLIRESSDKTLYIEDNATEDDTLIQAGIKRARAVISALPDDSDNVFTVLTARQLNSRINIVSRAKDPRSERKLRLAGADHVVLPDQIGGFYMAMLITKPGAIDFFSYITSQYQQDIGFEELCFEALPNSLRYKNIRELGLRQHSGVNIIGYKDEKDHYIVNPGPETVIVPQSSLIVLGSEPQLSALKKYLSDQSK